MTMFIEYFPDMASFELIASGDGRAISLYRVDRLRREAYLRLNADAGRLRPVLQLR